MGARGVGAGLRPLCSSSAHRGGVELRGCHGDVSKMTVYQNPQVLNMGWCLNCHRAKTADNAQNNPTNDPAVAATLAEERVKLTDCSTCHY